MESAIKIGYIMGYGRSGSTVLDIVLGNDPKITSVGELTNLVKNGWLNNEYCACGTRVLDCTFWSDVKERVEQKLGNVNYKRYSFLQDKFERLQSYRILRKEQRNPSDDFKEYSLITRELYTAISTVSQTEFIVDSSKSPSRALALSLIPGIDLRIIHLVRDGRGVAWSLKKSMNKDSKKGVEWNLKAKSVLRTSLAWTITNHLSELVAKDKASIRLGYEEFIKDPTSCLTQIDELFECGMSELTNKILKGETFKVGHTVAGNRLRMNTEVTIKGDTEWLAKLKKKDRLLFEIISTSKLRRYGYKG